jgi:hypothetical protein
VIKREKDPKHNLLLCLKILIDENSLLYNKCNKYLNCEFGKYHEKDVLNKYIEDKKIELISDKKLFRTKKN